MTVTTGLATGGDIYWIVLTVVLALIFSFRGYIKMLMNPLYAVIFIIILIIGYIVISAINIAYGINDAVNTEIITIAEYLK